MSNNMSLNWQNLISVTRPYASHRTQQDERSEFERDYDRIIYSSTFRRMADKAQVFPLEDHDSIRTRLTHSLEVSTIGRSLGRQVARRLAREKGLELSSDTLGTIVAATCLAHDLGNPPFGHFGEEAIRTWFRDRPGLLEPLSQGKRDDLLSFDGNAQGLRILLFLQSLGYNNGLNLTYATLGSFMKYVSSSSEVTKEVKTRSKIGYYQSEAGKVAKLRDVLGLEMQRHPLAFLMEAADDIAYSVVDIEDGLKKGVIGHDELAARLREALDGTEYLALVQRFEEQCVPRPRQPLTERVSTAIQTFRISAIGILFQASVDCFLEHYESIMAGDFQRDLLGATGQPARLHKALVDIAVERVYCAESVLALEVFGNRVIQGLLSCFVPACLSEQRNNTRSLDGKLYALISSNLCALQEEHTAMDQYDRLQLAVDYVAGMTDTYAVAVHRRLHGPL